MPNPPLDEAEQEIGLVEKRDLHSHEEGSTFRQLEWTPSLFITASDVGLPTEGPSEVELRQLAFIVDADDTLAERDEDNNRWQVTLCLFPAESACAPECPQ